MHTGSTDNYALTQFASSDKPAWLTDYNSDMRKIDAGMKGNADAIDELSENIGHEGEDIADLKERMSVAETDIDSAEEKIGTGTLETVSNNLIGAANELLGMINNESDDITALTRTVAGMGDAIDGVNQLAYTIANVYDSAQTYSVGDYVIYQNTLYKCTTAINVGEAFDPTKWTSVKAMNEISHGGISVSAEDVSFDDTQAHFLADNVQDAIEHLDAEGHAIAGELQTTTLATGSTTVTVNFSQSIGATTIITPVCSLYGVSPTAVTYTEHSITLTFEAQAEDALVGARIQTI